MEYLTDNRIPIGGWAKAFVDWLTTNFELFFDQLARFLSGVVAVLLWVLQTPHPLIVVAVITAAAWWFRRSLGVTLFTGLGLLLIINQGYWKETTETLALVLAASFVSMAVGVPLGIAAARRAWVYAVMRPILDLMQTIPTFVYLIPALILFGLGMVPGLIATVIFAIPAPIRLTRLGIIRMVNEVDTIGKDWLAQFVFEEQQMPSPPDLLKAKPPRGQKGLEALMADAVTA